MAGYASSPPLFRPAASGLRRWRINWCHCNNTCQKRLTCFQRVTSCRTYTYDSLIPGTNQETSHFEYCCVVLLFTSVVILFVPQRTQFAPLDQVQHWCVVSTSVFPHRVLTSWSRFDCTPVIIAAIDNIKQIFMSIVSSLYTDTYIMAIVT